MDPMLMILMKALGLTPAQAAQFPMMMRAALGGTAQGTGGANQMNPQLLMAMFQKLREIGGAGATMGRGAMNMTPMMFPRQIVDQVLQQMQGPQG